jgi:hypothetical protein
MTDAQTEIQATIDELVASGACHVNSSPQVKGAVP